MIRPLLSILLSASTCVAQDWHACSVWSYPVPVTGATITLSSHTWVNPVALLTTTNTPALLGNLRGATIAAVLQVETAGNPILHYGNDCGRPPGGNVRLYFTSTVEPYNYQHGMANPTAYWWADFSYAELSAENYSPLIPGVYSFAAPLNPALWSDALGHSGADPSYTAAFYAATEHVAQIGFSFGGGCFFDTGVSIYDPNTPESHATITVLDYQVLRPIRPMKVRVTKAAANSQ